MAFMARIDVSQERSSQIKDGHLAVSHPDSMHQASVGFSSWFANLIAVACRSV